MRPELVDLLSRPGLVTELLLDDDIDPEARRQLQAFQRAASESRANGYDAMVITIVEDDGTQDVVVPL